MAARKPGKTRLSSCSVRSAAAAGLTAARRGQLGPHRPGGGDHLRGEPDDRLHQLGVVRRVRRRRAPGRPARRAPWPRPGGPAPPPRPAGRRPAASGTEAYGPAARASRSRWLRWETTHLVGSGVFSSTSRRRPARCAGRLAGRACPARSARRWRPRRPAPGSRRSRARRRAARTWSGIVPNSQRVAPVRVSAEAAAASRSGSAAAPSSACSAARSLPVASGSASGASSGRTAKPTRRWSGTASRSQSPGSTSSPVRMRSARPRAGRQRLGPVRRDGRPASPARGGRTPAPGAKCRRTALGSDRISSVASSSRSPGTCQLNGRGVELVQQRQRHPHRHPVVRPRPGAKT